MQCVMCANETLTWLAGGGLGGREDKEVKQEASEALSTQLYVVSNFSY